MTTPKASVSFKGGLWSKEMIVKLHELAREADANAKDSDTPRKTITGTVTGTLSGDGECWCLEVNAETYKDVCGERDYRQEDEFLREMGAMDPLTFRLYPDDLFQSILLGSKVRITYTITEDV